MVPLPSNAALRRLLAVCLLPALGGCANHLGYREVSRDVRRVESTEPLASIHLSDPLVTSPRFAIELTAHERVRVRTEKVYVRVEESTPYEGWREAYEAPVGLVSLPLSITFAAVDVALLGYLPNQLVSGYAQWTISALNPALNIESRGRALQREVQRSVENVSITDIVRERVLDAPRLVLQFDELAPVERAAGPGASLRIDLLDVAPPGLDRPPRRLHVEMREGELTTAEADVFLDRALATRLARAVPLRDGVRDPETAAPAAAAAILAIENLGFPRDARELEDELYGGGRPEPFLAALRRALEGGSGVPASAAR